MALIVVLVMLTIAIATMMTFGEAGGLSRFRSRLRRKRRRPEPPPVPERALTAPQPVLRQTMPFGPGDAESVLVALLLTGKLSQRDYHKQMAGLAAEESARRARP
jgi:hypothetical protein